MRCARSGVSGCTGMEVMAAGMAVEVAVAVAVEAEEMAEVAEVAEVAAERCSGGRVSTPSPSSSAPTGSGARAHLVAAVSSRTPRAGSYPPLLPLSASSNRQQKEWRRRLELASARGSKHKIVSAWRGLSVGRRSPFRRCDAVTAMFCRAELRTLTPPPPHARRAPLAVTTCAPSVPHATAGSTSPSGACSACASPIFV